MPQTNAKKKLSHKKETKNNKEPAPTGKLTIDEVLNILKTKKKLDT